MHPVLLPPPLSELALNQKNTHIHTHTEILYGGTTHVYMLVILGIAHGVWLAVKRDTRCLVIAANVACRTVIKAKRTHCSLSVLPSGLCACVCLCTPSCEYSLSISEEPLLVKRKKNKVSQSNSRNNTSVVQQNRMELVVLTLVFLRAALRALFGCD